jgi:hypothetical protein
MVENKVISIKVLFHALRNTLKLLGAGQCSFADPGDFCSDPIFQKVRILTFPC